MTKTDLYGSCMAPEICASDPRARRHSSTGLENIEKRSRALEVHVLVTLGSSTDTKFNTYGEHVYFQIAFSRKVVPVVVGP
jgi:hypothetical protein